MEKELLHYEIFQALDAEGLLKDLVFQGGSSLRLCRGPDRFSEDLDFAGVNFSSASTLAVAGYDDYLASSVGGLFGQMQIALSAMAVAATAQARHQS